MVSKESPSMSKDVAAEIALLEGVGFVSTAFLRINL